MNGYWFLEGIGYWLSLCITSSVTVWAVMTSKNPAMVFWAFSVVMICCLLLNQAVLKMLGMPEAEESDERLTINVFGVLSAIVVSGVIGALVGYFAYA